MKRIRIHIKTKRIRNKDYKISGPIPDSVFSEGGQKIFRANSTKTNFTHASNSTPGPRVPPLKIQYPPLCIRYLSDRATHWNYGIDSVIGWFRSSRSFSSLYILGVRGMWINYFSSSMNH